MNELNKIYLGDCLELMKEIDDKSVDLIITDPPYKIGTNGCAGTTGGMLKESFKMKGKLFDIPEPYEYMKVFKNKIKDGGHIYIMCNNLNLKTMLNDAERVGLKFAKALIWVKNRPICNPYWMDKFEYILLFHTGGIKKNMCRDNGLPNVIENIKMVTKKDKTHITEKPVELMEYIIKNTTDEGDIVLDPFAGTSSTLLACKNTNRNFIGIEKDEHYFNISIDKISGYIHID